MKQKFIIERFSNIGTSNAFISRCMLQIFTIRDCVITDKKIKDKFDLLYDRVIRNLISSNKSKDEIIRIINKYADDFNEKKNFTEQNNSVILEYPIDSELNDLFYNFITKLHTAVKDIQNVTIILWYDLWFFYKKDIEFTKGVELFFKEHPYSSNLLEMLKSDRIWYSKLAQIRNLYNHHGYKLGGVEHNFEKYIITLPPEIWDIWVLWENSRKFIEDLIITLFSFQIEYPLEIFKIPKEERDPKNPIKYIVSINTENLNIKK